MAVFFDTPVGARADAPLLGGTVAVSGRQSRCESAERSFIRVGAPVEALSDMARPCLTGIRLSATHLSGEGC